MTLMPFGDATPSIDPEAWVADSAQVVGDVAIAADANIWFGAVLRGDVQPIRIGARTNIQDGVVIHGSTGGTWVRIGAVVTVGHNAILHGCTIEDGAFVGMGAILMDGVTVRAGGMVAAGALVPANKVVPAGEVWAGSPATRLRGMTPEEIENISISADRYVALARRYRVG